MTGLPLPACGSSHRAGIGGSWVSLHPSKLWEPRLNPAQTPLGVTTAVLELRQ